MGHILVTGGCGYIGSHVVKALSEAGEKVVVFDNLSTGEKLNLLHHEPLVIGDICDRASLSAVFHQYNIEAVLHFAALVNAAESVDKAELYRAVNEEGSKNVWELAVANHVPYALYASSAAVYGTPISARPITEDHPLQPSSPYGATKLSGEVSLRQNFSRYLIFRFFNVGGAEASGHLGQSSASRAIMPRLFAAAYHHTSLTLSGHDYDTQDGTVVRDFVHVEDIARAFVLGLAHLRAGGESGTFNLGSGTPTSLKQLHAQVEQITACHIPLLYAPRNPGDISYSLADITKVKNVLRFAPSWDLSRIISTGYHAYVTHHHP